MWFFSGDGSGLPKSNIQALHISSVIGPKVHTTNIDDVHANFQVQNNVRTLIVRTGDLQSSTLETNPSPSISRPRDL
jgi:hypothetical protein